jgi:hypothetical protein
VSNLSGELRNMQAAQEKAARANEYIGDVNQCASPSTLGMSGQAMACEESITSRLRRQQRTNESEYQKNQHALEILERHPEFEEFLWLLRANIF